VADQFAAERGELAHRDRAWPVFGEQPFGDLDQAVAETLDLSVGQRLWHGNVTLGLNKKTCKTICLTT